MRAPRSWDIFCRVVDYMGDAGFCWRLARRLGGGQRAAVRLWMDNLAALHRLSPAVDPGQAHQHVEDIEVHQWRESWPGVAPAEVAVEAFGCGLPDAYTAAMAERTPRSLWITLEYLSAEAWVREHHGLPSPPPRLPLARYFFFPGFDPGTGGVLCEDDLLSRRNAFGDAERRRFWSSIGFEPPETGAAVVSLFAYDRAPAADLLAAWECADSPTVVAVPEGTCVAPMLAFLNAGRAAAGQAFRRGRLEVRIIPFVPQSRYDELLWSCDCNFVRGEDSFVRAQWAARPFVWQIYRQREQAHGVKLEAFLDRYCEGLGAEPAGALRRFWGAWNSVGDSPVRVGELWGAFWAQRAALAAHAVAWTERLGAAGELAERLAQFCADKLKYRF